MEARIEPKKERSMSEMQRKIEEEKAKRHEAVQRKCAMMPSSHEAANNFAN